MNKEVRISGTVTKYEGHPQTIIESPNQIEISKDSIGSYAPTPSPTPTYSDSETDERDLEDAGIYLDENGEYVDEEGSPVDLDDYREQ